ncbi:MAG: hypothetical protein R3360_03545, partial [Alphaproteobacteria bacterium]|nr:hypothetical protein [Alphaproteobacteria bacterium]
MINAVLRFVAHPHINPMSHLPPESRHQFMAALVVTWTVVLAAALVLWLSYSQVIAAEGVVVVGA